MMKMTEVVTPRRFESEIESLKSLADAEDGHGEFAHCPKTIWPLLGR